MDWGHFFTVHRDLPREGPGEAADVAWAVALAGLPEGAAICDAACGPGGDIADLLAAAPVAHVTAFDRQAHFIEAAAARHTGDARVSVEACELAEIAGLKTAPFDLIWCAGALYFLGLDTGPTVFRKALKDNGVLAFSEPAFFTETPTDKAQEFWEGYPTQTEAQIVTKVAAQGYEILGTRRVSEAGWEGYYQPIEARIEKLRPSADAGLSEMLDMCADEGPAWRAVKDETGYLIVVARKSDA